jgi:hypothetical protein
VRSFSAVIAELPASAALHPDGLVRGFQFCAELIVLHLIQIE